MNTETWIRILQQHYPIDISENCALPQKSKDPLKQKGPRPKRSAWNVHKFGGSSFENADSYTFVASLINKFDGKNLVVVSALSGITNQLYSVCRRAKFSDWQQSDEWLQLITRISSTIKRRLGDTQSGFKEIQRFAADILYLRGILSRMASSSPEDQESIEQMVVGYGEIWSARLMTQTMRDDFHRAAAYLDARDVLVVDQQGLKIDVCWEITKERLKKWFYNCRYCDVLIVTGFIARSFDGMPTTLKRNGSDFSATIFSVLTKANSVTIWKDVDGMYTADPKKYPGAQFIPHQTFEEAEEASRRGAFVIQADCIEPAKLFNIPIFLRNCFRLECPGTRIGSPISEKIEPLGNSCDHSAEEKSTNDNPVDHLLDSIETPISETESRPLYSLCSDMTPDTVTLVRTPSHADDMVVEIIV
jgi:aspartokinase/homoserine dehydrogenase 1